MALKQRLKSNIYLQYLLVFVILAGFIFAIVPLTGSTLIWNSDGITQHYPALVYWQKMLKGLIFNHQMWSQWDWNVGLGTDTIQTFSYYVMGDIFTYPSILFSQNQMVAYYSIMVVVRLFLIGLSFTFVAKRLIPNSKHLAILVGAIIYTFSGYTAYVTFAHPFFLNPLIILPLLVLGLYSVLNYQRYLLLIISVAWALFNNFYLGTMLAIGMMIYWLILLITTKKYRQFALNLKLIGSVILGAALSAILLLPSMNQLLSSARATSKIANGLTFYPYSYYFTLPGLSISNANRPYWVTGGIMTLGIIAIIWSLRRFKQHLALNVTLVTGGIILLFPTLAALMNGGSSPSNRWSQMLLLPIALAAVHMINDIDSLHRRDFYWFTGYGIIAVISLFMADNFAFTYDLGGVAAIYFVTIFILLFSKLPINFNHKAQLISASLLILVGFNAIVIMRDRHANQYSIDDTMLVSSTQAHELTNSQQSFADSIAETKTTGRSSIDNQLSNLTGDSPADNLAILAQTFNINSYWSLQNKYLNDLSKSLENNTNSANDAINNADYRTTFLHLIGVSNVFLAADNKAQPANYQSTSNITNGQRLYNTTTTMPLIYKSTGTMSNTTFSKLSPTKREVALINNTIYKQAKNKIATTILNKVQKLKFFALPQSLATTQHVKISLPTSEYTPTAYSIKIPESVKGYELHVRLTNIKYTAGTLKSRYDSSLNNYIDKHNQQIMYENDDSNSRYNTDLYKLGWLRQNLFNVSPTTGATGAFTIAATYGKTTNTFNQVGSENLSFYNPRTSTTLNMGNISTKTDTFSLHMSNPGTYEFDVELEAVPTGTSLNTAIKANHAAKNIKMDNDMVTATYHSNSNTVLATTIPYSSGWKLTGYQGKLPVVNKGFIGIPVKTGNNQIKLTYSTPYAKLGIIISLLAALVTLSITIITNLNSRRRKDN